MSSLFVTRCLELAALDFASLFLLLSNIFRNYIKICLIIMKVDLMYTNHTSIYQMTMSEKKLHDSVSQISFDRIGPKGIE